MRLCFLALLWACEPLDSGPVVVVDGAVEVDGEAPPDAARDAENSLDFNTLDATDPDADPVDATPERDADRDAEPDAEPDVVLDATADAAEAPDVSWGPCAVEGRAGECLPTALCPEPRAPVPGHCPGPADIQCCVDLPEEMLPFDCDPADHPQPNEGLEEARGDPGCPPGMAAVAAFCMDRYEAALIQADGSSWSPYHHPGERPVRAVSLAGAVPQGYLDGRTAEAACVAAGKRLCTDREWLRACQGEEERTYPYGEDRQPGVCNDARAQHPAVQLFPNDPNPFARIQHPCINQLPDSLDPTGSHPECVVPEGIFDLMGNLHEWTADPEGTFRGGFYVDTVRNGPGCLYRTTAHDRGHWDYSTGFRCCADPR